MSGSAHILRWERIAVVTDIAWILHTVNAFRSRSPERGASLLAARLVLRERIAVSEA